MSYFKELKEKLKKLREKLSNFSRKNKELYFRPTKGGSINLSLQPEFKDPKEKEFFEKNFDPLKFRNKKILDLLKKGELDLNIYYFLNKFENKELEKKIDKIRLDDDKYQREFGISGAWLMGPFLCWKIDPGLSINEMMITPIFKIPIDIKKERGARKWKLVLEEDEIKFNPTFLIICKNKLGIDLEEILNPDDPIETIKQILVRFNKENKKVEIKDQTFSKIPKIIPRSQAIKNEDGDVIERKQINAKEYLSNWEFEIYESVKFNNYVLIDCVYIDNINASKLALFNDYGKIIDSEEEHPILSELLLGKTVSSENTNNISHKDLDKYLEHKNPFVVDIDASQHLAIEKASRERAIVLEGPPGTGKSQTITNLISDLLTKNKKVLFVAEKRAALDVVYNRLTEAKIKDQCIIIHTSSLDRTQLYKNFLDLFKNPPTLDKKNIFENTSQKIDRLKKKKNQYFEDLTSEHSKTNLSVSDIFTLFSQHGHVNPLPEIGLYFSALSYDELEELKTNLNYLQKLSQGIDNLDTHPWKDKRNDVYLNDQFKYEFKKINQEYKEGILKLDVLEKELESSNQLLNLNNLSSEDHSDLDEILSAKSDYLKFLELFIFLKSDLSMDFLKLQKNIDSLSVRLKKSYNDFKLFNEFATYEKIQALKEYYSITPDFTSLFTPSYWRNKKELEKVFNMKLKGSYPSPINYLTNYLDYCDAFREYKIILSKVEGVENLKVGDSNHDQYLIDLPPRLNKIWKFLKALEKIKKNSDSFSQVNSAFFNNLISQELLTAFDKLSEKVKLKKEFLGKEFLLNKYFESGKKAWPEKYNEKISHSKSLEDTLGDLVRIDPLFRKIEEIEEEFKLEKFKSFILKNFIKGQIENWDDEVYSQVIRIWHDEVRTKFFNLRDFNREIHENEIAQLKTLFTEHKDYAHTTIQQNYLNLIKEDPFHPHSIKVLENETNKKRKIKSPRELMETGADTLEDLMKLKPCWLMSPLSISQILPNYSQLFDVIIFDEASQIRVEDAIPSIFRAKKMIVVGDRKQMPPTNFFDLSSSEEDDDEDEDLSESILDLACNVYPSEMLEWHYRSREEVLIAFSNAAFYGKRLIAAPNPHNWGKNQPIEFIRVENAYFNGTDANLEEARQVIKYLKNIILKNPNSSIGVITPGVSQQKALEKALDEEFEKDSNFKEVFETCSMRQENGAHVGVFIKNLENVQGDERDHIIFSVGYAPSGHGHKLRRAFGPISSKGGGRRLNVAITRAKVKMTIFCSFKPEELSTGEVDFSKNQDGTNFARYLHFAQAVSNNNIEGAKAILSLYPVGATRTNRSSNRFEKDVKNELEKLDFKIIDQVGSCNFYIDLAVAHPTLNNTFVLGIECDGAVWHSDEYSRSRDKIRQELLESRGWNIERVMSQEWSTNRKGEIIRLKNRIESLLGKK